MKTGLITASYLDPLAVRIESVRLGKHKGWRRFLVFTALTKGRKGSEYVALFTYFSFEGMFTPMPEINRELTIIAWLRIVFAEGPRQVINALTLYSVLQAKLIPVGAHAPNDGHTPVLQFFINVRILANASTQQATILFGMLYVLIIWIFSALSLALAFIFYITFLWHHIPSADGSLSQFCQRKVEKRLNQIVRARVDKAIAKEHLDRVKKVATGGTGASVGMPAQSMDYKRQPTIPILDMNTTASTAGPPRQTGTEVKPLNSRPASPFGGRPPSPFVERPASPRPAQPSSALSREPTVPDMFGGNQRPEGPSRVPTQSSMHSDTSYGSDAPLMAGAAEMGYRPPNQRSSPSGPSRMESDRSMSSNRRPPPRSSSAISQITQRSASAGPSPVGAPNRQNVGIRSVNPKMQSSQHSSRNPVSRDPSAASSTPSSRRPPGPQGPNNRPTQEYEMHVPSPPNGKFPTTSGNSNYIPFNPSSRPPQPRNFTHPFRPAPPVDYFGESRVPPRAGTAPVAQSAAVYDDSIYDAYGASEPQRQVGVPARSATAGPGPPVASHRWNGYGNSNSGGGTAAYKPPKF